MDRSWRMEWRRSDGEWVDVAETGSKGGLEAGVKKLLGFGYETFTASVLLLQGKSERLIEAGGLDRFNILSGILDLDQYERLATRAKGRTGDARASQQYLITSLEQAPAPPEAEVAEAGALALEAERLAAEATTAKEAAAGIVRAATVYAKQLERLATLRGQETEMLDALKDAATIRLEATERDTLVNTLPRLKQALTAMAKGDIAEGEARAARGEAAAVDLKPAGLAVKSARNVHADARVEHQAIITAISAANAEKAKLAPELAAAREVERLDRELATTEAEVAALRADCADIEELRARVGRLTKLDAAKRLIADYRVARQEADVLAAAGGDSEAARGLCQTLREEAEAAAEQAATAVSDASTALTRAETELAAGRQTLAEREEAGVELLRAEQQQLEAPKRELQQIEKLESDAGVKAGLVELWDTQRAEILRSATRLRLTAVCARDTELRRQQEELSPKEERSRQAEEAAAAAITSAESVARDLAERKRTAEEWANLRAESAKGHRQVVAAALTAVSAAYLPVTKAGIEAAERRFAELDDAPARLQLLARAESDLGTLRGQIGELQGYVDVTPVAARVAVPKAEEDATRASEMARLAGTEATASRRSADQLAQNRRERLATQLEAEELGKRKAVWDQVAQLLGRGGIQTALMRDALEEIERLADVMLTKISGGQLELSITCEQSSRGEEIYFRCLDAASAESPLDVAFLSGGQRFRCAVALAAGIGQHTGLGATMPSLIVDEGFGSLDAQGRTEMLEEIRQMSEFCERVIVVSHLDSFHDRSLFPAGYELRKEGMRTVATRTL